MRKLLGAGSSGPEQYSGRDKQTAHQGMNISEREFMAALDDILGVMDEHEMGQEEKGEVLALLYATRGEILHV